MSVDLELLLHFLKFDIRTQSLDIKPWIERLYVSNDLTHRFPHKLASLRLCVERKDAATAASLRPPAHSVFAETNLCDGRCYYEDGRFFSANYGEYWHEIEYELNTHTVRANLGGKYLESGQFVISNIVRPLLQSFILPFYGVKTLHGAVVGKERQNFLLAGPGAAGKTTTALQLMRAGYALLSDDGPFFVTDNGCALALSSLDYLHLTEDTLRLFPLLERRKVGVKDQREKFSVRMSDLQNTGALTLPLQITHYIRLRRGREFTVPRITVINRNTVHRNLVDECMVIFRRAPFRTTAYPFQQYTDFVFDLLTKVVQQADTFELEFSDQHLSELPALLNQL
jgi:hypothetical protein